MASVSPAKSSVNQGYQNDPDRLRELRLHAFTILLVIAGAAMMFGLWLVSQYIDKVEAMARPRLFADLVDIEGLDRSPSSPAFHLTLDAQVRIPVSGCCNRIGGANSMLRVSYHGMLLAWGHVPTFSVCGGVAAVEAKDAAAVLREEVRALIQSEQHVVGSAEFDVEGEVAGLGYLHCKAFLLQSNATEGSKGPCQVNYCH